MFWGYDLDGRLATWEFRDGTSILCKDQSFDAVSRITAISDPNTTAASQAYQYDLLDRLTVAQTGSLVTNTQQFSYDEVGNRLTTTIDSSLVNLTYPATSHLSTALASVRIAHRSYENQLFAVCRPRCEFSGHPVPVFRSGFPYVCFRSFRMLDTHTQTRKRASQPARTSTIGLLRLRAGNVSSD